MRAIRSATLVIALFLFSIAFQTVTASEGLGFWEINLKDFKAETPMLLPSPVPGNPRPEMYYIWVFSFKNNNSLVEVKKSLEKIIAHPKVSATEKQAQKRSLDLVNAELAGGNKNVRMFISLHTDTGKTYINVSDLVMRSEAQKRFRRKLLTVDEIASGKFAPNEEIWGVAIFREVDPESDGFEIRVGGLGKRVYPSYYPGFITTENQPYEAKMRKVVRFFYSRPGSSGYRQASPIKLENRTNDWVWMWDNEVYPDVVKSVDVVRSVTTAKGDLEIRRSYRYFNYDIFNSTAKEQKLVVLSAGLSPKIDWQGLSFNVDMIEDGNDNSYRKRLAVRQIAPKMENTRRHISGAIAPGMKATGLAVVEKDINDADALLKKVISELRLSALGSAKESGEDDLISEYRAACKGMKDTPVWKSLPLPSDEEVTRMVLAKALTELEEKGIAISEEESKNYGKLAPFAVLMNNLVAEKIQKMATMRTTAVVITAMYEGSDETVRLERLTFGEPAVNPIVAEPKDLPKLEQKK